MAEEGQVVLFRFPQTDQKEGKLRPALLLRRLPGCYNDWLICMISSQTHQVFSATDELVSKSDKDYKKSGLKHASVIRATRLAVVQQGILEGAIGKLGEDRLTKIRISLANWIMGSEPGDAG